MKPLTILALLIATTAAHALGGNPNVCFSPVKGAFRLIDGGMPAAIRVDETEWPGVKRAVNDLGKDLAMVAGTGSPLPSGEKVRG